MSGSQLYAGLQSGEIDITQPTMSVIPEEDYDSVEALSNVNVVYGEPVTNQSVFIQTKMFRMCVCVRQCYMQSTVRWY